MVLVSPFRSGVLVFEGLLGIALSVSVLIFGFVQFGSLSIPLGAYCAIYTLTCFVCGRLERRKLQSWWINTLLGLAGLLVATVAFLSPLLEIENKEAFSEVLLGIFSLVSGLLGVSVLLELKYELHIRGLFVVHIVCAIILGILLLISPFVVIFQTKVLVIVYGFVYGLTLIPGAFKLPYARR